MRMIFKSVSYHVFLQNASAYPSVSIWLKVRRQYAKLVLTGGDPIIIVCFVSCLCGAVFVTIGLCARRMAKPMWFWSGSTVKPEEISDIPAYNRANCRMWIGYSLFFWLSALLALLGFPAAAGTVIFVGAIGGALALIPAYNRIYRKYAKKC